MTTIEPDAVAASRRPCISVEPVAVIDGVQDRRVVAQQRLVLELQVLREGHHDLLHPGAGELGVEVDDVLTDVNGRERRGVDLERHAVQDLRRVERHGLAGRRARDDDPGPDREHRHARRDPPLPRAGPGRRRPRATQAREAARERAQSIALGLRRGQEPLDERASRAYDHEAGEQPDLRPELVGLRRHQERAHDRDEQPEHDAPDAPGGDGLRVRDHEEQEDQDLGRGRRSRARSRSRRRARTTSA